MSRRSRLADNGVRFAALSRMAAEIGGAPFLVRTDICMPMIGSGTSTCLLHYADVPARTVMTVHNLAYQGKFPHEMLDTFGLPPQSFTIHGVEYYGTISFLKRACNSRPHHDVSPTYAIEIQEMMEHGTGDCCVNDRGPERNPQRIDISVWNPETDPISSPASAPKSWSPCGEQGCPAAAARP